MQQNLIFHIRIIFIIALLSTSLLAKNDYHIVRHNNITEEKKYFYKSADYMDKCASKLFSINASSITIKSVIDTLQNKCKFVLETDKDSKNLMQTKMDIKVKNLTLTELFHQLLTPYGLQYTFENYYLKIVTANISNTTINKDIKENISLPAYKEIKHTAPKVYSSLSYELETFNISCKIYQKLVGIDTKIKNKCKKYSQKVKKAFRVGHKLDPYYDSDNISETKLDQYYQLLIKANEEKENLEYFISTSIYKARTSKNIDTYLQLIKGKHIHLTQEDYSFMDQFPNKCKDNTMYTQYQKQHRMEIEKRAKAIALAKKQKDAARKANNAKILKQAQEDLEKQIKIAKEKKAKEAKEREEAKQKEAQKAAVKKGYAQDLLFYSKACDAGDAVGCFGLGLMYRKGEGVKQDDFKAAKLYTKACDIGYAGGCLNLGVMYVNGHGVKQDDVKAKAFFGKACDGGNADGCKGYAILKEKNKKKQKKAEVLHQKIDSKMIGESSESIADKHIKSLLVDCQKNNSVKACEEGAKLTCGYGISLGNYVISCKDNPSKFCFIDDAPKEVYYINELQCGTFRLMVGLNLYEKGDFIGAKNEFEAAIRYGEIRAQKAMGILCSQESWVCNKSSSRLW